MSELRNLLELAIGLGQTNTEQRRIAFGVNEDENYGYNRVEEGIDEGTYHIVGNNIILRALPSASSPSRGMLQNGDDVYAFGNIETDFEHILGENNEALPNTPDSGVVGIDYALVGTEKLGAGWVAIWFLRPGSSSTQPSPQPSPQPQPKPMEMAKKSNTTPILIGVLGGVAVLGAAVLAAKHLKPRAVHA